MQCISYKKHWGGGGCIKGHHNIISMGRRALVVSIYEGNIYQST